MYKLEKYCILVGVFYIIHNIESKFWLCKYATFSHFSISTFNLINIKYPIFYLGNCDKSKLLATFTSSGIVSSITITKLDPTAKTFTGVAKQPSSFPKTVPISGTIEDNCKGFITPCMNLGPPLPFKFSSDRCTLDYLWRVFTGKGLAGDPC